MPPHYRRQRAEEGVPRTTGTGAPGAEHVAKPVVWGSGLSLERTLFRIGSLSAIIGGILAIVVNGLHPRDLPGTNPEAYLHEVAENTIWLADHTGIFLAIVLVVGGLLVISRSITKEPGAAWARLGAAVALVSVALAIGEPPHSVRYCRKVSRPTERIWG